MTPQSVLRSVLAASALVLALSGCRGGAQYYGAEQFRFDTVSDVEERHPILVDKESAGVSLRVRPGAAGLTRAQKAEVRSFVSRYRNSQQGSLVVRAPSGADNEASVSHALDDVHDALYDAGVSRSRVDFDSYAAFGKRSPAIRISYGKYVAQGPECGAWPKDLSRDRFNTPYANWGCATQHNLAAMVDNPRDLVQPRGVTPRSSERRDVTWDKYVKGDVTAAEKSEEEKAAASDVKSN